jgi:nitrous oxide reductase accessory protein NosL
MYSLSQSDVLDAIKKFHHSCNPTIDLGGVGAGVDVFAKYGSALTFMCNYGGKRCKNDEFDEAFNMIKGSSGDHSGQNTGKSSLSGPIFETKANVKC